MAMTFLNINGLLDEVYRKHSTEYQLIEMLALGFLGFLIPFVVGAPQIVVGILVNALIIRSALSLQSYKTLPIIFTPSLGALMQGMLFGPMNYFLTLALASIGKAGLLYAAAFMLFSANFIPAIFLSAMGIMQLITAVLGGFVVYVELKAEKYF